MSNTTRNLALRFIILLGISSLFADATYEGARSITGPFLSSLGANATIIGFVAGLGELIGYSFRLFFGFLADKTQRYWLITIFGYFLNLVVVPLLAFTGYWQSAAVLLIFERLGKAIRVPSRDTMLSYASQRIGMGWGFGIHESLDKLGAMLGPIIITIALYDHKDYRFSFLILAIPAFFSICALLSAYYLYPHPKQLAAKTITAQQVSLLSRPFWFYLIGAALIAMAYADFAVIAYHFKKTGLLNNYLIPLSYALAMGMAGLSALILGRAYDRYGFVILLFVTLVTAFAPPLLFLGGSVFTIMIGMMLWGIGVGSQQSLMSAIIGNMVAKNKRASAYGVFMTTFGIAWFIGSIIIGSLYDYSIMGVVIFISVLYSAAIIWLIFMILIGVAPKK